MSQIEEKWVYNFNNCKSGEGAMERRDVVAIVALFSMGDWRKNEEGCQRRRENAINRAV